MVSAATGNVCRVPVSTTLAVQPKNTLTTSNLDTGAARAVYTTQGKATLHDKGVLRRTGHSDKVKGCLLAIAPTNTDNNHAILTQPFSQDGITAKSMAQRKKHTARQQYTVGTQGCSLC